VVHLPSFFEELKVLEEKGLNTSGRLLISDRAHLVFDFHQIVDGLKEKELGRSRSGLRVHHLSNHEAFAEKFRQLVENRRKRYGYFEYDVEGEIEPNALMLDLDFGTYPFVTSSNTTIGGVSTGLGIPPTKIDKVIGVVKAYTTRVGGGPFPTELTDEKGEYLQRVGAEYGATTGRKRSLNLTKLDVLDNLNELKVATAYCIDGKPLESFPADLDILEKVTIQYEVLQGWKYDISKCRRFSELPENAQKYVKFIENYLGVPSKSQF
ncbi:1606_t:CDS:2, partial [Racocetra fulgida]